MLYNYNAEYTMKHSAACYDVAINSTSKIRLSFNLAIVYQIWYLIEMVVAKWMKWSIWKILLRLQLNSILLIEYVF